MNKWTDNTRSVPGGSAFFSLLMATFSIISLIAFLVTPSDWFHLISAIVTGTVAVLEWTVFYRINQRFEEEE